jgi:hypothetical protein
MKTKPKTIWISRDRHSVLGSVAFWEDAPGCINGRYWGTGSLGYVSITVLRILGIPVPQKGRCFETPRRVFRGKHKTSTRPNRRKARHERAYKDH